MEHKKLLDPLIKKAALEITDETNIIFESESFNKLVNGFSESIHNSTVVNKEIEISFIKSELKKEIKKVIVNRLKYKVSNILNSLKKMILDQHQALLKLKLTKEN